MKYSWWLSFGIKRHND